MVINKSLGNGAFVVYHRMMAFMRYEKRPGFTLIELLVVIAIIGILASTILASLNTARKKARDSKRLSDLKEIKLALSMFFDDNRTYPADLLELEAVTACGGRRCMPVVGKDPIDGTVYPYFQCSSTAYHLGASLEDNSSWVLRDDFDVAPSECGGSSIGSDDSTGCGGEANRYCYDTTP